MYACEYRDVRSSHRRVISKTKIYSKLTDIVFTHKVIKHIIIHRYLNMAYNINTLFYIEVRAHAAWSLRGNVLSVQTSRAEGISILILKYMYVGRVTLDFQKIKTVLITNRKLIYSKTECLNTTLYYTVNKKKNPRQLSGKYHAVML